MLFHVKHPEQLSYSWSSPCSWPLWGREPWTLGTRSPEPACAERVRRPESCPAECPAWHRPPARPETTSHLQQRNHLSERKHQYMRKETAQIKQKVRIWQLLLNECIKGIFSFFDPWLSLTKVKAVYIFYRVPNQTFSINPDKAKPFMFTA